MVGSQGLYNSIDIADDIQEDFTLKCEVQSQCQKACLGRIMYVDPTKLTS